MKQNQKYRVKTGNPEKMGATVCENGVNFTVEIPENKETSLLLYKKGTEPVYEEIPFTDDKLIGGLGTLFLEAFSYEEYEYNYRMGAEIVTDPYGTSVLGKRCGFVSFGETAFATNSRMWIPYAELILYKLHVRGFSKQAKVRKKGTFAGVEERIDYLRELGVNGVEFMPMYAWQEELRPEAAPMRFSYEKPGEPLENYWGYAQSNRYFAPKSSFAAGNNAVAECRHMIETLHEAGMECIMEFYFPQGTRPNMVLDALGFWKLHYGVDGFHLIGPGVPVESVVHYPLLKKTKLFFDRVDEDWIYGSHAPAFRNIAEYNNDFMDCGRRFLKGDDSQVANFVYQSRKNPARHGAVNYMANVNGFTLMDVVSYDRKHNEANGEDNLDGMDAVDIWNCGAEGPSRKRTVQSLRKKQLKNAMLYTLLAQGTPLIYQGDECCNTQNGNNNAYAMDNEVGWVNWKNTRLSREFFDFTKGAIAFRKAHPILHMPGELRMVDYRALGFPDLSYHDERAWYSGFENSSRYVGCMYCGAYAARDDKTDDFLYVAYNSYWEPHEFALPTLPEGMTWQIVLRTDGEGAACFSEGEIPENQKQVLVPERTVMVLTGKRNHSLGAATE